MIIKNREANPAFKALYVRNTASLEKGIDRVKPELECLAKVFDVFISANKSKKACFNSLDVTVKKPANSPEGYYVYDKPVRASLPLALIKKYRQS